MLRIVKTLNMRLDMVMKYAMEKDEVKTTEQAADTMLRSHSVAYKGRQNCACYACQQD